MDPCNLLQRRQQVCASTLHVLHEGAMRLLPCSFCVTCSHVTPQGLAASVQGKIAYPACGFVTCSDIQVICLHSFSYSFFAMLELSN